MEKRNKKETKSKRRKKNLVSIIAAVLWESILPHTENISYGFHDKKDNKCANTLSEGFNETKRKIISYGLHDAW